jgi:hypothetical protein
VRGQVVVFGVEFQQDDVRWMHVLPQWWPRNSIPPLLTLGCALRPDAGRLSCGSANHNSRYARETRLATTS